MLTVTSWIRAFRLRTLPLALSSVGMGSFLAAYVKEFKWPIFWLSAITTILLQILSNLANDYGDFKHGADSEHREGPQRLVQSGIITPEAMKRAILLLGGMSLASGIYLLYIALGFNMNSFLLFFGLGIFAIVAAVYYTFGKRPYGYLGFGDLSVLIFFGFVGVLGSFYLHTSSLDWTFLLPALTCGSFSVAVLNVNNIRDIESDRAAGKLSIPVRIGKENAIIYHWILLTIGISAAIIFSVLNYHSWIQYAFLLTLPLLIRNAIAVKILDQPAQLDPFLKQMAIATLLFVITFGFGLISIDLF